MVKTAKRLHSIGQLVENKQNGFTKLGKAIKLLKTTIHKVMSGLILRDQTRADKVKCN